MIIKSNQNKLLLIIFSILNLIIVCYVLSPAFILKETPIGYVDFMQHFSHAEHFKIYMDNFRMTWGYNPKMMAGFPDLTIFDLDNKLVEYLTFFGSKLSIPTAISFKAVVFLEMLLAPFALYPAAKNFQFSNKIATYSVLGGIIILNSPLCLFFNLGGMFSFVFGSFVSFYTVSLWYNRFIHNKDRSLIKIIFFTSVAPLIHSMAIVMICIPIFIMFVIFRKQIKKDVYIYTVPVISLSLVFNLPWMINAFKGLSYSKINNNAWTGIFSIRQFFVFWILGIIFTGGGLLAIFIAFNKSCKLDDQSKKVNLFLKSIFLVFMSFGAPLWWLVKPIQPTRFTVISLVCLLFIILNYLNSISFKDNTLLFKCLTIFSILIPVILITVIRFVPFKQPMPLMLANKMFSRKLDEGTLGDPRTKELINWLNNNTQPSQGRIMLEYPQGEGDENPFMTYYVGLMPAIVHYIDGEFIGAPRFEAPLLHNVSTRFSDTEMFGINIEEIETEYLLERIRLYNVKWIVAINGKITEFLNNYPEYFIIDNVIGNSVIYKINPDHPDITTYNYFLKGDGNISVNYSQIKLSALKGNEIIIKYHWDEHFVASEDVVIEPYFFENDEIGFIRIMNPPDSLTLTLKN